MNAVDIFTYGSVDVRTVVIDGEPWFVASDVARILGYREAYYLTRGLDDDEKGPHILRTPGGDQELTVINEPGLYSAILRSRVDGAKRFKRWVTHEVLPAIRRTGQYGSQLPASFAEALELAAAQARQVEALEAAAAEAAPKVAAYDQLMDADGYYDMNSVAKMLGTGRTRLYQRLRDEGIILRGSTQPAQRYVHHFKLTTSTYRDRLGVDRVTTVTRVRPDGLAWLFKRLGERPLPGMERPEIEAVA